MKDLFNEEEGCTLIRCWAQVSTIDYHLCRIEGYGFRFQEIHGHQCWSFGGQHLYSPPLCYQQIWKENLKYFKIPLWINHKIFLTKQNFSIFFVRDNIPHIHVLKDQKQKFLRCLPSLFRNLQAAPTGASQQPV